MSNLLEVADLAWSQLFPKGSVQTSTTKEEFIASAKMQFAYESLLMAWKEKAEDGYFNVPSYLLTEVDLDVVGNEIDISGLSILRSLPQSVWLVNIGGLTCTCKYVKSDVNLAQLLCDDDSMDDAVRSYLAVGQKIKFPQGTHKTPITFIYANSGENVNNNIEIDGAIASIIQDKLIARYGGKTGKENVDINEKV